MVDQKNKKIDKVVKGKVKKKKTNVINSTIMAEMDGVKSFIITDILIPEAKKLILDIVQAVLRIDSVQSNTRRTTSNYVSYNKYSQEKPIRANSSDRGRVGYRYDNVIFDSRADANDVLKRMDELIDTYQMVSVADFYDLADVESAYTDNKYGWTNIRSAEVVNVREGYIIKLPKALPLD